MDSGAYLAAGIAGVSCIAAITAKLYRHYRPRFPITVNCWFCNTNTKVPYGNRNCWDCPNCEQYNGFSQDGDYNKPIPAQFVEEFNYPVMPIQQSESFQSTSDVLCFRCQQNQDLKIRQLASFVPYSEATFDYEVTAYKRQLEQTYKLCRWCEQNVYDVLDQQDRMLKKQHGNRDDVINSSQDTSMNTSHVQMMRPRLLTRLLRWISLVFCLVYSAISCVSVLSYVNEGIEHQLPDGVSALYRKLSAHYPALVLTGLLSALLSVQTAGKDQLQLPDTVMCVCWLLSLFLSISPSLLTKHGYQLLRLALSVATLVMVMWSVGTPRFLKPCRRRIRTVKCHPSPEVNHVTSTTAGSCDNERFSSLAPDEDVGGTSSDEECFSDFETMSLGSVHGKRRHKPDIFTSYTNKVSVEPAVTSSTSPYLRRHLLNSSQRQPTILPLKKQKPILVPARFKPSSQYKHQPLIFDDGAQPSTSKKPDFNHGDHVFGSMKWAALPQKDNHFMFSSLTGSGHVTSVQSDRASLFSEPRNPCSDFDDETSEETKTRASRTSGQTSVCPVDTTSPSVLDNNANTTGTLTPPPLDNTRIKEVAHTRIWLHPVFVFSVLFNVILLVLYLISTSKLGELLSVVYSQAVNVVYVMYYQASLMYRMLSVSLGK